MAESSADWIEDCLHWWDMVLDGPCAHWCPDWDDLPIDAFQSEFVGCTCDGFKDQPFHAYWNWKLEKANKEFGIREEDLF